MGNLLKSIFLILLSSGLIHCSNKSNTKNFPKEIFVIEGTWQLENSQTFEIWHFRDSIFKGNVIKTENSDTTILENLRIFKEKNGIFYEATVPSQNNGLPVKFKLIQAKQNEFIFENKKHDFPKKINYTFPDAGTLVANVSGNNKEITFKYLRIK
ncbi:MAG: hypothetical protein HN778_06720 [Prolixibacteraceae bacterium]|jgi:hypothetical protein|nr:hypothetical protein [Prolixibacteraceae bacterium]MBT6763826.1 hypothetical protein [Prolixibacteraceae bacterium]MBT7394509.1 hypothetical protein [Prolixibacteraceae bacterium]